MRSSKLILISYSATKKEGFSEEFYYFNVKQISYKYQLLILDRCKQGSFC